MATMARDQHPAIVWLDRWHALVARTQAGRPTVTEVEREADPEDQYLLRVLHEAEGCDRLVVMGPDASRIAFEREYVSLYRRPERLIDAGAEEVPPASELVDRLRLMEPASAGQGGPS